MQILPKIYGIFKIKLSAIFLWYIILLQINGRDKSVKTCVSENVYFGNR